MCMRMHTSRVCSCADPCVFVADLKLIMYMCYWLRFSHGSVNRRASGFQVFYRAGLRPEFWEFFVIRAGLGLQIL